jgi:hypothetical protein
MPNINSIPEVLYEPNQPYHYHYDNLPLRNILTRIGLVNIQVETNTDMIRGAAGTAGSVDNRLNLSLEGDGTLKTAAVDATVHGIGHHSDGEGRDKDGNLVEYVRMTAGERAKLNLVQSESNRLVVEVEDSYPTVGDTVTMSEGVVRLRGSSSVLIDFEAPDIVRFHSAFPPDTAHRHHYSLAPAHQTSPPDFKNFKTTALNTVYVEGSLRVYVNGVRLSERATPVPNYGSVGSAVSFFQNSIADQSHTDGTFSLAAALSSQDVVVIDFDEQFAADSPSASSASSDSSY